MPILPPVDVYDLTVKSKAYAAGQSSRSENESISAEIHMII